MTCYYENHGKPTRNGSLWTAFKFRQQACEICRNCSTASKLQAVHINNALIIRETSKELLYILPTVLSNLGMVQNVARYIDYVNGILLYTVYEKLG